MENERVRYNRTFVPDPEKTFHRGATDYFLHGRTPHMANWATPKSTGEYIGEVLEIRGNTLRVRLKENVVLHNGDGLTIGSEGCSVNGVEGNIVKVNHQFVNPSIHQSIIPLFRNLDAEFVKSLHAERRIPVDIVFRERDDGFELCYIPLDDTLSPLVGEVGKGMCFEEARDPQRAMDAIRTQLARLGGTPYTAREIHIETKPYFLPISILNDFRRQVLSVATLQPSSPACVQREKPINDPMANGGITEKTANEPMANALMECKYCLLFEMGHCRKTHPFPQGKEPRYLRLRTGKRLRLTFDCPQCRMLVTEADRKE